MGDLNCIRFGITHKSVRGDSVKTKVPTPKTFWPSTGHRWSCYFTAGSGTDFFAVGATLQNLHDFDALQPRIEGEGKRGGGSSRMFPLKCFTDVDGSLRRQWKERTHAEMSREGEAFVSTELLKALHFLDRTPTHVYHTQIGTHDTVGKMDSSSFILISAAFCTYTQAETLGCRLWRWISARAKARKRKR